MLAQKHSVEMPLLHCPVRLRGHRHYSNSLCGCHTGSTPSPPSVAARRSARVGWSRQTAWELLSLSLQAILSTGQMLMTLSTDQAAYKHPKYLSQKERECVCVYAKVSNSQHLETISKTPADRWHKLNLHLTTYMLEGTGLLHTSCWHSECEAFSHKLL